MYYHVLMEVEGIGKKLYLLDQTQVDMIEKEIVEPFLRKVPLYFHGYLIDPSRVQRILITATDRTSEEIASGISASNRASGFLVPTPKEYYVTESDRYCTDITRDLLARVTNSLKESEALLEVSQNVDATKSKKSATLFLAHSFRPEDEEFITGFRELLIYLGFTVLDGKADRLGSISKAVRDKIKASDIVVVVMTKRDRKENGQYTPPSWLIEEKAVAVAFEKRVAMFVEDEVDTADLGGLQGDDQLFHFTRNNFLSRVMSFVRILDNL